ncbi:MAG: hypothetical protein FJW26_11220 [Acidimicrobiia bacterium]|nr:hypothetical protein [Acidimicrobiia bacterium]
MKRRTFLAECALAAGTAANLSLSANTIGGGTPDPGTTPRKKKPAILFYHDGRHPLVYMYEPPMSKEEYESPVDELAGTPVEALVFEIGSGVMLYDTRVGELWGHNVKRWPMAVWRRAHQNARMLIDAGYDPLRVLCDRAHAKGMLLYPSLIVQTGAGPGGREGSMRRSDFSFDNRRLEIGAGGGLDPNFPGSTVFDFKHAEVRDERFRLIDEVLARYPIDGFELQLTHAYYFRPDEIESGRNIMTEWIAKISRAVKASGREREFVIRIDGDIGRCYDAGLDIREWIRQGLVDALIGEPPYRDHADQTADFRPLVAAAKGSQCRVHAVIGSTVGSDRLGESVTPVIRAAACNYWAQGVQGLCLAQWQANWPYQASFYESLRELPYPDVMAAKDKIYYVPTITCRNPQGLPGARLPEELRLHEAVRVELPISDDLARWHQAGRLHEVLLRLRVANTTELDRIEFFLNGQRLPASSLRRINEMFRMTAPRCLTGSSYWFIYRLPPSCWPKIGDNVVEVRLIERDPDVTPKASLRDVELEVKYLMGKSFHRGQDPDLGAYDRHIE